MIVSNENSGFGEDRFARGCEVDCVIFAPAVPSSFPNSSHKIGSSKGVED